VGDPHQNKEKVMGAKYYKGVLDMSSGNRKLGYEGVLVFNMTPAIMCPSAKRGMCQLPKSSMCYARRDEQRRPSVREYRYRQMRQWQEATASEIAIKIMGISAWKPVEYVRFSEAGDFRYQCDVDKLIEIACYLPHITFYGYTARRDLDFSHRTNNLVIQGSGFMIDNEFRIVEHFSGNRWACIGNCTECDMCKEKGHRIIEEVLRR